jgi:hypothetical protein
MVNNKTILKEKQELSQLMKGQQSFDFHPCSVPYFFFCSDMLEISSSGKASVLIEDDVDAKYDALGTSIATVPRKSAEWNALMHHVAQHRFPQVFLCRMLRGGNSHLLSPKKDHKNMGPNGCNFGKNKDPGAAPAVVADLEKKIVNIFALQRPVWFFFFWCFVCV